MTIRSILTDRIRNLNFIDPITRILRDIVDNIVIMNATEEDQNITSIISETITATDIIYSNDFELTGEAWEDLRFPVAGINPPGSASDPDRSTDTGCFLFDSTLEEVIAMQVQLPHNWKVGTPLYPHIHWAKSTSAAGNVAWKLHYRWCKINSTIETAISTISYTTAEGTPDTDTAYKHLITPLTPIYDADADISDILIIRLSRVPSDVNDTYGADAMLAEFDIHYQIDSFGSDEPYSKH